jgi:hypothetical protein
MLRSAVFGSCTLVVMDQSVNPYAPPKHDEPDVAARPTGDAARFEAIRREHLNAEANIKGLGIVLYLGAAGLIMTGLPGLAADVLFGSLSILIGGVMALSAYWLRRFDRRGRMIFSIIVALGVLGMVLRGAGPEPAAYQLGRMLWPMLFLLVLWAQKASTVMTPHYRDVVVPATPHIEYKPSPVFLVFIGLVVLLIVAVIAAAAM